MQTSQISFYKGFFENSKGPETSFQAIIFREFSDESFSFVYYINWPDLIARLFTFKVIQ